MNSPPEEDAVPEVLEQRRMELAAFENDLETSRNASIPVCPLDPPDHLARVMGAMHGEVVQLEIHGHEIPVWLGMLVAGSTAANRLETERVAAVCLDALDMGAAEALASKLTDNGLTVLAAPLPAVGNHREPLRRRRAVHPDPDRQARQSLFKARHGLDALIEQATIHAGDRPVLIRASLGAVSDLVAQRQKADRFPVMAVTEDPGLQGVTHLGAAVTGPRHRSHVFGIGTMVQWLFRPDGPAAIMRLQVPRTWWDTYGTDGANRVTGWVLALMAREPGGLFATLEHRLEHVLQTSAVENLGKGL